MPPDRGRASQACTACRKQKTRCYESGNGACLRCQRLQLSCSLSNASVQSPPIRNAGDNDFAAYDERLTRLERVLNTVVERLDKGQDVEIRGLEASSAFTSQSVAGAHAASGGTSFYMAPQSADDSDVLSAGPSKAPVFVIRDVATEMGLEQREQAGSEVPLLSVPQDVVGKGLLSVDEAITLLRLFNDHYGRWVSLNERRTEMLLQEVRQSPLLLCACCLIAVRHRSEDLASRLAPKLFREVKALLSACLLVIPQTLAFFQASLILSLWSTTIGQVLLSIDSWLASGFALQHSFASDIFLPIMHQKSSSQQSREDLRHLSIWNHLCLVHLHYSVGTRRKPLLDRAQIDKCRLLLDSDNATNFEYRMVAEVYLYWIIYESCSKESIDLPKTQADLHTWKQEWKFLFDQPRSQFVQMGFHFAQLLVFDQALKSRSAAVRESLLSEMVRLAAAILHLAMDTTDDRTRHLTDHIYHVITFAAVTLCRLLHMYEDQLSSSHNILELDQLLLSLVIWLHSIGLPCHVAHSLGDVVAAFHKKLRPDARPTPSREELEFWDQPEFSTFFPDLLGNELYGAGNYPLLPDWEPFVTRPAT